jgi:hypothetical protein
VETFIVRVFIAGDVPGPTGVVERPGSPERLVFHDLEQLAARLASLIEAARDDARGIAPATAALVAGELTGAVPAEAPARHPVTDRADALPGG